MHPGFHFAKASGKVGHRWLVEKPKWYGIDGAVNESFLKCRSQRVVVEVEGTLSDELVITSGLP